MFGSGSSFSSGNPFNQQNNTSTFSSFSSQPSSFNMQSPFGQSTQSSQSQSSFFSSSPQPQQSNMFTQSQPSTSFGFSSQPSITSSSSTSSTSIGSGSIDYRIKNDGKRNLHAINAPLNLKNKTLTEYQFEDRFNKPCSPNSISSSPISLSSPSTSPATFMFGSNTSPFSSQPTQQSSIFGATNQPQTSSFFGSQPSTSGLNNSLNTSLNTSFNTSLPSTQTTTPSTNIGFGMGNISSFNKPFGASTTSNTNLNSGLQTSNMGMSTGGSSIFGQSSSSSLFSNTPSTNTSTNNLNTLNSNTTSNSLFNTQATSGTNNLNNNNLNNNMNNSLNSSSNSLFKPTTSPSIFSLNKPATNTNTSTSIPASAFGGLNQTGSLFGSTSNANTSNSGGSLFSMSSPSSSSNLFSSSNNTSNNMFKPNNMLTTPNNMLNGGSMSSVGNQQASIDAHNPYLINLELSKKVSNIPDTYDRDINESLIKAYQSSNFVLENTEKNLTFENNNDASLKIINLKKSISGSREKFSDDQLYKRNNLLLVDEHIENSRKFIKKIGHESSIKHFSTGKELLEKFPRLNTITNKKKVKFFTIKNLEYGGIQWLDVIDITNVNFDDIFEFNKGLLEVNGSNNPNFEKVNKRAEIWFENIWPKNEFNERVKTDSIIALSKYEKALREFVESIEGNKFIEYDYKVGRLIFTVENFNYFINK